jgi:uncharacterized protein YcbK (DUF882 family)
MTVPPAYLVAAIGPHIRDFIARARAANASLAVTSWYRSRAHNDAVGGARFSQHLLGLALDTVPVAGAQRAQLAAAFRRQGLTAVDEGDHLHVQRFPAGALSPNVFAALAR